MLYQRLVKRTLSAMLDEKDELYDLTLKNLAKAGTLNDEAQAVETPTDQGENQEDEAQAQHDEGRAVAKLAVAKLVQTHDPCFSSV